MDKIHILQADLDLSDHADALIFLLDAYACDPMGGGDGLDPLVKNTLISKLRCLNHFHCLLAFQGALPVGLLNSFEVFSTFSGMPLLNIHDLAVVPEYRCQGIASLLMKKAEQLARELGCCKLTLEVLEGNQQARSVYQRAGFVGYTLDPEMGKALCLEKKLL